MHELLLTRLAAFLSHEESGHLQNRGKDAFVALDEK